MIETPFFRFNADAASGSDGLVTFNVTQPRREVIEPDGVITPLPDMPFGVETTRGKRPPTPPALPETESAPIPREKQPEGEG